MRHDLLADTFSIIKNTEEIGRHVCVTPASKLRGGSEGDAETQVHRKL